MKKSGLSPVVATVLLIMLVILIALLVWTTLVPYLNLRLELSRQCFRATESIALLEACKDGEVISVSPPDVKVNLSILVAREGEKEFNLIDFQFGGTTTNNDLVARRFYIAKTSVLPSKNGRQLYSYDMTALLSALDGPITVAPVIQVGDAVRVCEIAGSKDIDWCPSTKAAYPTIFT